MPESIPVKVVLLCHLYNLISYNQRYLEDLAEYDDFVLKDFIENRQTLALLENQIDLGVKYAK